MSSAISIREHCAKLTDPRRREVTQPLINIVFVAVCGVICGADDFVAVARRAETRKDRLARLLDIRGRPSHDRFHAVLAAVKPAEFENCLLSWITALHEITAGQMIPVDGKSPIHMVSAWTTAGCSDQMLVAIDQAIVHACLELGEFERALSLADWGDCERGNRRPVIPGDAVARPE